MRPNEAQNLGPIFDDRDVFFFFFSDRRTNANFALLARVVSGAINHRATEYAQGCLLNKHVIMYMNPCLSRATIIIPQQLDHLDFFLLSSYSARPGLDSANSVMLRKCMGRFWNFCTKVVSTKFFSNKQTEFHSIIIFRS